MAHSPDPDLVMRRSRTEHRARDASAIEQVTAQFAE